MSVGPGTVFAGDYRIERPLSQGGMGAVYVVRQLSTGKQRALKLMHGGLVYDPDSLRRFEQEARVGARIASEHVVEVQAAGVDAATGLPYLVMELLEGEDLATRLRRGPLAPAEMFAVLEQLAHALGAAHAAGVVHRDLKPENVFLGVSRRMGSSLVVKVLDFGIAKVTADERRTTAAYGTPMWLAPEQTRRGEITPAADVWAFGLLVFTMMTGHVFWRSVESPSGSVATLMNELLNDPIPLASSRAAEYAMRLPEGLDAWLACALARDPGARFSNVRIAFAALAPVLRPLSRQAPAGPIAAVPSAGPRSKIGLGLAFAILALVLIASAAAYVFVFGHERARAAVAPPATAEPSAVASVGPAPTASPSETSAPSPSASAAPTTRSARVGGFIISSDHAVQDDAQKQLNETLATKLEGCFPSHPPRESHGSVTLMLTLAPSGAVASARSITPIAEPVVPCMVDTLQATTFAASKRGTQLTFALTWSFS